MQRAQLGKALQKHGVPRREHYTWGRILSLLVWSPKRAGLKFCALICLATSTYVYTMFWGFGDDHAALQEAKFSQYRFSPRLNSRLPVQESYGFSGVPIQISELNFKSGSKIISMAGVVATNPGGLNPEGQGPEAVIDGTVDTKFVDFNHAPIILSFPAPVTLTSFRFATARDFADRDPARWRMEGSNNGKTWTLLHLQTNDFVVPGRGRTTDWFDWFDYDEPAWGVHLRPWDSQFKKSFRGDQPMSPQIPSFLQCRFIPVALRRSDASGVQISEIEFRSGEAIVKLHEQARADPFGGISPVNEEPAKAIDGNLNTKWYDQSKGPLTVTWKEAPVLTSFRFVTANDYSGRDPVRWDLKCSKDQLHSSLRETSWAVWHHQHEDYATPILRRTPTQWFALNLSAVPEEEKQENFYGRTWHSDNYNYSHFDYSHSHNNDVTSEYCFHTTKLRNEEAGVVEISEIEFRNDSSIVEWPIDTYAFLAGSKGGSESYDYPASNAIDENVSTKLVTMHPMKLCLSTGKELNITAFRFQTTDKYKGRDPIQWELKLLRRTFYGEMNSTVLHAQHVDYATPVERRAATEWFELDFSRPFVNEDEIEYNEEHYDDDYAM